MPRIFMHLRDGVDILLDAEGSEIELDAIPAKVLCVAREIIGHDAMRGRINLGYSIEARDEADETVYTLSFRDAVEIVGNE